MTRVDRNEGKSGLETRLTGMMILIAMLSLPAINPEKVGWLTGLVPLPVFYYLIRLGKKAGFALIRNAVLLAAGAAMLFGSLPLLFFSLSFVAPGIVFFRAAQSHKTPVQAGFYGIIILGALWLLFWTVFGITQQTNPYKNLLETMDQGLTGAFAIYRETAKLPAEATRHIEAAIEELRVIIPKVLPALLITGILGTVWLNLALGNWLLKKKEQALAPWRDFREWQLPDKLIWGVIGGAFAMIFFAEPLSIIGLNVLLIWGALYTIQGLAILVSLLGTWAVPAPFRVLIYILVIIQTYGIILLTFVGVADVWADFRKLNKKEETETNHPQTDG